MKSIAILGMFMSAKDVSIYISNTKDYLKGGVPMSFWSTVAYLLGIGR